MAAKDIFHNSVVSTLLKDGWEITADPLIVKIDNLEFRIDLRAARIFKAQKGGKEIAVEVKSFVGLSPIYEFHLAVGQILNYRYVLRKKQPDLLLYLAVNLDAYQNFFSRSLIQEIITEYKIKLLIFDSSNEEIILWKE